MSRAAQGTFLRPTPPHSRVDPTSDLSTPDSFEAFMLALKLTAFVEAELRKLHLEDGPAVARAAMELAAGRMEASER